MKTFKEFLTEQSTRTQKSAKAIETALSKNGIQFKRKNNIHDVVFTLPGGYKIVTDGQMIDLMKGSKDVYNWDNRTGADQKAVEKYQDLVGNITEQTTYEEFLNEEKIKDMFELSDEDVSKIKRVMTAMDEPMSPAIAVALKKDLAKLQKRYGMTYKEMYKLVNETP